MTKAKMKEIVNEWNKNITDDTANHVDDLELLKEISTSVGGQRWCTMYNCIEDIAFSGNTSALKRAFDIIVGSAMSAGKFEALLDFQRRTDNFNL